MRQLLLAGIVAFFAACNPVDRSDEQPLAPTVKTVSAEVVADSVLLTGEVLTSHNSNVTVCGFSYGNDTLRSQVKCAEAATVFSAYTDSLGAGTYFAVAYATNGIGTTYGDTITFIKP